MPAVGEVGHHPPEHGIAEELEPLVARRPAHLCTPRAVGERAPQQLAVAEFVAEALLELRQVGL